MSARRTIQGAGLAAGILASLTAVAVGVRRGRDPSRLRVRGRLVARQLAPDQLGFEVEDESEDPPDRASPARALGPERMTARGVGSGYALRERGGYRLGWSHEPVWLADQEGPVIFLKNGGGKILVVEDRATSASEARAWLDAMRRGAAAGPKLEARDMGQRRVVYPSPHRGWRGPFLCDEKKPGANAAANFACGRWPKQRDPIEIALHDAGDGWAVAVWPWGSLAAGTDRARVMAAGEAIARGVNEHGRMVAVA
jgi:hypothetical protein